MSPISAAADPARTFTQRRARDADVGLLAEAELMVSVMPDGHSLWADVGIDDAATLKAFVEALFALRAWHWVNVEDFTIIEADGAVAGLVGVFDASHGEPRMPIDFDRISEVGARIGWDAARAAEFARRYRALWGDDLSFLVPQAPAIVETVAVMPAFRGMGVGDRLMEAAKADARARGFEALGVMVVVGNTPAERLYARHFEPFLTYHAAYFGGAFPGIAKFRAALV